MFLQRTPKRTKIKTVRPSPDEKKKLLLRNSPSRKKGLSKTPNEE